MAFLSSFYPQPVVKGTTAGTFAEGNDSRIAGAAQKSANLSDLVSASSARSNLGLGTAATSNSGDFSLSSHGHGNISNTGTIGSTAGLPLVTTTSGAISTLALGTANQVLRVNSQATAVEFANPSGGGSGGTKTYAIFTALDNNPPATSFATIDQRNSTAVLDFDDATTESAVFVGIMPEAAVLTSGLIVVLDFTATTATSDNVRWAVSFERGNTDLDSDSFDTATAATVATSSTSGVPAVASITCTSIDGITAGDLFRLRVQRLGAEAADTMLGDAELVAVEIRSAA